MGWIFREKKTKNWKNAFVFIFHPFTINLHCQISDMKQKVVRDVSGDLRLAPFGEHLNAAFVTAEIIRSVRSMRSRRVSGSVWAARWTWIQPAVSEPRSICMNNEPADLGGNGLRRRWSGCVRSAGVMGEHRSCDLRDFLGREWPLTVQGIKSFLILCCLHSQSSYRL